MGKSSLYKCRHCPIKIPTKDDYWNHVRIHFKPEKLLTCEECCFVTEYKHHFEYHQRNHAGYKPFKCEHCDYSCVNKSMLNSHLKSHSSVYDHHCGDCKYETKYIHSLKMHLTKYNHQTQSQKESSSVSPQDPTSSSPSSESGASSSPSSTPSGASHSGASTSSAALAGGLSATPNIVIPSTSTSVLPCTAGCLSNSTYQQDEDCILDLRIESKKELKAKYCKLI